MRAQKKLIVSILILPLAYADLILSGSIDHTSIIGTITATSEFFNEVDGFTTDNTITIPIIHNGNTGWVLSMRSPNGGAFTSEANRWGNGYSLGYTIGNCTLSNSDHGGVEDLTTDPIHLHVGQEPIAAVSSPKKSTNADLSCDIEMGTGVSVSNLLSDGTNQAAYEFSDTIYITLAPYSS